jgi:cyanophycin synthetase
LGGAAQFNVANALAAILATRALGVPLPAIADALRTFESSFAQNPGRMNITRAPGFTTIVDYAHNPAALRALQGLIETMRGSHSKVIGVVSVPGDRRDEDIREIGGIAGEMFDELIFRERPDGRGRVAGGVISLLSDGASAAGVDGSHVQRIMDEHEAMDAALRMAGPDDLVVVMPTKVDAVWEQVMSFSPHVAEPATIAHA